MLREGFVHPLRSEVLGEPANQQRGSLEAYASLVSMP